MLPGTRGHGRKKPGKKKIMTGASPRFLGPFRAFGSRLAEPWKKSSTQAQGFNFQLPPPALARASRVAYQQSELRQRRHSIWRCTRSGVSTIRKAAAQRELARSRSIPVSAKPAGKPLPASLYRLLPIFTVALAVSQACLKGKGRGRPDRASEPGRPRVTSLTVTGAPSLGHYSRDERLGKQTT